MLSEGLVSRTSLQEPVSVFEKALSKSAVNTAISGYSHETDEELKRGYEDILRSHHFLFMNLCTAYSEAQKTNEACQTLKNMLEYFKALVPVGADTTGLSALFVAVSDSAQATATADIQDFSSKFFWVKHSIKEEIPFLQRQFGCTFGKKSTKESATKE